MGLLDRVLLLAAGGTAIHMIWNLVRWQKDGITKNNSNLYHLISFSVLLISCIILMIFGWDVLGFMGDATENRMVAVIASAIPFAWATGLVSKLYPKMEKFYLGLMLIGLLLITYTRFMDMKTLGRILYPVFHSTAGLTVMTLPILAVIQNRMKKAFMWVSIGGALISLGGISMAFLISGRQLLFMSTPVLLTVMAPLLLVTAFLYSWGLRNGNTE